MNYKRLKILRRAARVVRYHTVPTVYRQSVGEHTFGIVSILYTVCPNPSGDLVKACVYHDVPEAITGDAPATAKWRHKELETVLKQYEALVAKEFGLTVSLSDHDARILKYCDLMELIIFSCEEVDSGNTSAAVIMRNGFRALVKRGLTDVTPEALSLYELVRVRAEKMYDIQLGADTFHGWPDYD